MGQWKDVWVPGMTTWLLLPPPSSSPEQPIRPGHPPSTWVTLQAPPGVDWVEWGLGCEEPELQA